MLGHGSENRIEFEERSALKPGYTLVTLVEYGTVSFPEETCMALRMFSEPEYGHILKKPRENKAKLENMLRKNIHVYTEGQKIPSLMISPLVDWDADGRFTKMLRSGVQPFPIPQPARTVFHSDNVNFERNVLKRFPKQDEAIAMCHPYMFFTKGKILKPEYLDILYEHSIYPTIAEVGPFIGRSFYEIKAAFLTPVEKLMERFGPGVYYFVICRDTDDNLTEINNFLMWMLDQERIDTVIPADMRDPFREALETLNGRYSSSKDRFDKVRIFLTGLDELPDPILIAAFRIWRGAKGFTRADLPAQFPELREFLVRADRIRRNSVVQQIGSGRKTMRSNRKKSRYRRSVRVLKGRF